MPCNNASSHVVVASETLTIEEEVTMKQTETAKTDSTDKKSILVGAINLVAALMTKGRLPPHQYVTSRV